MHDPAQSWLPMQSHSIRGMTRCQSELTFQTLHKLNLKVWFEYVCTFLIGTNCGKIVKKIELRIVQKFLNNEEN